MDQAELTGLFCARPQNFAWFLGAGASRSAGLPTANDILWDLKRKYYCREENQEISRQDIQNNAVRERIQSYMESKGFPAPFADGEYPAYFEKIFAGDKERQRRYIGQALSEDNIGLAVGHRVLGAFIASQATRAIFTTNFDSVVENAVAQISGQPLAAYHLEGSHNAVAALNNEEYPIYCKLHGDFRYDSLKNLPNDLASQNEALSDCLVNAGNRFGFLVVGYSGRDASVMEMFHKVLDTGNPFPHGLFWAGIKGFPPHPAIEELLKHARDRGVRAEYVAIETFDSLLLRLWRNTKDKPPELDAKVRRTVIASASIPLPSTGRTNPILRLNALPISALPKRCLALTFREPVEWENLRQARRESEGRLILTKSDKVLCWGQRGVIEGAFGAKPLAINARDLPADIGAPENLWLKGFLEEAITKALARGKPLLCRTNRTGSFLIADRHAEAQGVLGPLHSVVGKPFGEIAGLFAPVTEDHPNPERVYWAEALSVSVDVTNDRVWLQLDPDIWVWPQHARRIATDFLDKRRGDRLNQKYNALLDAWVRIVLGTDERNTEVTLTAFGDGDEDENPSFRIGSRTAFARRLVS